MSRILDVYFHEMFVGKLIQNLSGNLSFQYDEEYINLKAVPAISISMPLRREINVISKRSKRVQDM
ncbi:MAG: hypothetical protein A2977_03845 [Alphaproteobacteria bacterium RIFCSPLOWO2_01_FULL_45_8]|nr:MAG: hypothetical protein A2065_04780 [Alphaproteobacteria bacterium GWB1_45_5]OFW76515.1 MAG: hypothetical protein A3K20_04655 [Alphaproteobacteria bacterium GWA1_45_9]OFW90313.1 MAG: hypothetical protein A2621_04980 [Alphaproteobacteria bacterium RIFCSPHIGHO2_01_FULL_41_14]OFW95769.1 MAG: hypothetical protein A2977_03845 [Alphaproteobacteria bacterium RIFCSPLOWO2_01_FULL_45_8]HCI48611.1 hypothetical protein [Holosporales bacterium]